MVVLVAYASENGSTKGVAERIGERMAQRGLSVEVKSMAEVRDVVPYDVVVLGSAIHGAKWLPEGKQFVELNTNKLKDLSVWLFSVSTLGDEESMFPPRLAHRMRAMRKETDEIADFRSTLHAREHRNFAGAIARTDWPHSGRVFFRSMGGRYGDHRDWPAIDAWADHIAAQVTSSVLRNGVERP